MNGPAQESRFSITINLGADCVEHYEEGIAIDPRMDEPKIAKPTAKLTIVHNDEKSDE